MQQIQISPDTPEVVAIETALIIPSQFEAQKLRRDGFSREEIEEFSRVIAGQGLLSPIHIRPAADGKYEIVFGERRFLAIQALEWTHINCFIKEISDLDAMQAQYQENHQRKQTNALHDARAMLDMKVRGNLTNQELADRLGIHRGEVTKTLKLNDLIAEAAAEFNSGSLLLTHARHLAGYSPKIQLEIVDLKLAYIDRDRQKKAIPFHRFAEIIEKTVLCRLGDAVFDLNDERLHIKKLKCGDCTERSDYDQYLFLDLASEASCLNAPCFRLKTDTHLKLEREAIAASMPNVENKSLGEVAKTVPLVTEKSYAPAHTPFGKANIQTEVPSLAIPECEYSELSLNMESGKRVYSCQNEACEIHNPKPKPAAGNELSEDERERLWADYNRRVLNIVREQILTAATDSFDDYSTFWAFDDLIRKLIVEFWWMSPIETKEVVHRILGDWKGVPTVRSPYFDLQRFVKSLDKRGQSQVLFLLLNAGQFAHRFDSDRAEEWLENLAADYTKLNYHRLDAEARLELAPEEFKPEANLYLQYVRNGHLGAEVPVFWIEEPEDGNE